MRDCSKAKNNTFSEISIPIVQDIENKIKMKNLHLRKKARDRIEERHRSVKNEEYREMGSGGNKKEQYSYFRFEK